MRLTVQVRSDGQGAARLAGAAPQGGPLANMLTGYGARVAAAAEIAVRGLTEAIKLRARQRVRAGNFRSARLPNVIRANFYDNRKDSKGRGPTGIVASAWRTKLGDKDKLEPFATGAVLRPLTAERLVIPLRKGPGFAALVRERLLQLGSDPTLGIARLAGGKMLVYDRRGGKKNLALALLTPSVTMPKKIDFSGIDAGAGAELAERFDAAMDGPAR